MAWIVRKPRKNGTLSYKVCWWEGGRQHSETKKTSEAAKRRKREVEHQMDTGTYRDPNLGKVTFATFYDHFMKTSPPDAPATRSLYEMHARRYLLPNLGSVPLNSISMPRIKQVLADLQEQGVGAPTISAVHRLLRRVMAVAVEEGRIYSNPASGIKRPAQDRSKKHFLAYQACMRCLVDEILEEGVPNAPFGLLACSCPRSCACVL